MKWPLIAALFLGVACGGDGPTGGGAGARKPGKGKLTVVSPEPTEGVDPATPGRITGRVRLDGERPVVRRMTEVKHTSGCLEEGHEVPLDDRRVVDAEGNLANAVLILLKAPDAPPAPTEPLLVDQIGCMFVPHVTVVQAGRPVLVRNSDGISHNVRLDGMRNEDLNRTIGPSGTPIELTLTEPEACTLACDFHPWMRAHLVVVEHPWFAVSAKDGTFSIEGIPPGTYGLEAWHERYGRLRVAKVLVTPAGTAQAEVLFKQ